jgi:hypothetical protein
MGFAVDTVALAGLPGLLDRLADDARAGRAYAVKHTDLPGGEGLLNLILGTHREVVGKVTGFFDGVEGGFADRMSTRVQMAINYYRRADAAAAAALDATMPAVRSAGMPTMAGAGPGSFTDRAVPQAALVPPPDYAGTFDLEQTFPSLLSPVGMSREVIWKVTGFGVKLGLCDRPIDPYIEFVRPFVGDWAGFRACADVFDRLGTAAERMGWNVHGAASGTQASWHGNAADGCRDVLMQGERALSGVERPLRMLSERYKEVAEQTHDIAGKVAGLLAEAVDYALMAVLAIGLAGLTAETVVGGIAFSALAIERVIRCVETLHLVAGCVKAATEVVLLGMKAARGFNVIAPDLALPALPSAAPAMPSTGNHQPV